MKIGDFWQPKRHGEFELYEVVDVYSKTSGLATRWDLDEHGGRFNKLTTDSFFEDYCNKIPTEQAKKMLEKWVDNGRDDSWVHPRTEDEKEKE